MPSMASITQRRGGERRVIYSIFTNKSKRLPRSVVEWGPEVSKDNIPGRPQFLKAEETCASFPLLVFDIWPLDAEEPVLCFRCERIWLRWIPFHISFLPFWEPVVVTTLKVSELQPHARPASLRRVDFLSIPADPKRGTQEGESQATRQTIQKHRSVSEKTQRFCLNHRQVTST